jgi:hypothetical protein
MTDTISAQPERPQGTIEMDRPSDEATAAPTEPSTKPTDRYGLGDDANWLLRQYIITEDAEGLPQFEPIPSLLKQFQRDASDILDDARGQMDRGNKKVIEKRDSIQDAASVFHSTIDEHYGEISVWIPRTTVVWPIDNQVARHLFQSVLSEWKFQRAAANALRYGRIKAISNREIAGDENLSKQDAWVWVHYTELGLWDSVSQGVEDHSYNLDAMVAQGYRQQCSIDTKKYLRNGNEHNPESFEEGEAINEEDLRAALRSRRSGDAA